MEPFSILVHTLLTRSPLAPILAASLPLLHANAAWLPPTRVESLFPGASSRDPAALGLLASGTGGAAGGSTSTGSSSRLTTSSRRPSFGGGAGGPASPNPPLRSRALALYSYAVAFASAGVGRSLWGGGLIPFDWDAVAGALVDFFEEGPLEEVRVKELEKEEELSRGVGVEVGVGGASTWDEVSSRMPWRGGVVARRVHSLSSFSSSGTENSNSSGRNYAGGFFLLHSAHCPLCSTLTHTHKHTHARAHARALNSYTHTQA